MALFLKDIYPMLSLIEQYPSCLCFVKWGLWNNENKAQPFESNIWWVDCVCTTMTKTIWSWSIFHLPDHTPTICNWLFNRKSWRIKINMLFCYIYANPLKKFNACRSWILSMSWWYLRYEIGDLPFWRLVMLWSFQAYFLKTCDVKCWLKMAKLVIMQRCHV